MKKVVFSLFLLFFATSLNAQKILVGDMNDDNELDIKDVTELVNVITGKSEKRYISPVEVFIRENKLTGKFKVDGVEKSYIDGEYDPYNGHEFVDLGLSVKWATCNVGANSPEGYGGYYSWGDLATDKVSFDIKNYSLSKGTYRTMQKYCDNASYGVVDNKVVLESCDDIAHAVMGGEWRIPTVKEQKELHDNCTWYWYSNYNNSGVAGFNVVSKVPGYTDKSIFIPAAGCYVESTLYNPNVYGYYWSSNLYSGLCYGANSLYFSRYEISWDMDYRESGLSVRAVCK